MVPAKYLRYPGLTNEVGKRIYDERYRQKYEPLHEGKYISIDVESGEAGLGDSLDEAMKAAREVAPNGWFYSFRIGYPNAFRVRRY